MKIPPLKRFTPRNIFVQWPKSLWVRFSEKYIRRSFLGGLLFSKKPVILTDAYSMRFVLYPWAHEPLEKLLSRRYLAGEYEAFSRILKKGDTVIDVGANIGTHTVYMSRLAGDTGRVYSFEPVPETYWLLQENLALNRIKNVEVVSAALKEKDDTEIMHIFPADFSEWNSFGVPDTKESKPENTLEVKTIKLDTFTAEKSIDYIDFLKIDVEGSEKDVFQGAVHMLQNGKIGVLSFEVSEAPLKGMKGSAHELFSILASYSYVVYEYDARAKKFIGPITDSSSNYKQYYASKARDLRKL